MKSKIKKILAVAAMTTLVGSTTAYYFPMQKYVINTNKTCKIG